MTQKEYKEKIIDKFVLKRYETNLYLQGKHLIYKIEGNTQDNTQNCGVSFVKILTPNSSPKNPFYIIFPIIGGVMCYFGLPNSCIYKENDNYYVFKAPFTPKIDTITGINSIIDPKTLQITSLIINGEEQTIPPIDQIPEILYSDIMPSNIEMFDYVKNQIIANAGINHVENYSDSTVYNYSDNINEHRDVYLNNKSRNYINTLSGNTPTDCLGLIIYKTNTTNYFTGDEVIKVQDDSFWYYIIKRNNQILVETKKIEYM